MGSLTNYGETVLAEELFNHTRNATDYRLHLALCTSDPGETATIGTLPALSGDGYDHSASIAWDANAGLWSNTGVIVIPPSAGVASADWSTVTHWALLERYQGGSYTGVVAYGAFAAPFTVRAGCAVRIAAYEISIGYSEYAIYSSVYDVFRKIYNGVSGYSYWPTQVALCTATVGSPPGLEQAVPAEPGSNYARVAIGAYGGSSPTWTQAASGVVSNAHEISFAVAAANWGTVVSVVAVAASGYIGAYVNGLSIAVGAGDQVVFAAGELTFTVT